MSIKVNGGDNPTAINFVQNGNTTSLTEVWYKSSPEAASVKVWPDGWEFSVGTYSSGISVRYYLNSDYTVYHQKSDTCTSTKPWGATILAPWSNSPNGNLTKYFAPIFDIMSNAGSLAINTVNCYINGKLTNSFSVDTVIYSTINGYLRLCKKSSGWGIRILRENNTYEWKWLSNIALSDTITAVRFRYMGSGVLEIRIEKGD